MTHQVEQAFESITDWDKVTALSLQRNRDCPRTRLDEERILLSQHTERLQEEMAARPSSSEDAEGGPASPLAWVRRKILGISPDEVTFIRRGFESRHPLVRKRLEHIGLTFLRGYHSALECAQIEALVRRLDSIESEFRGFAFEGAAMGLTLLDYFAPWNGNRLQNFLRGPADAHAYMVHVGVGWGLARVPWRTKKMFAGLDPLLRWLAIDGYGFHEGYFHWRRYVDEQEIPSHLSGYALRVFDQGLGRSLWFIKGADIQLIASAISVFPQNRRADLWSGVGIASAYAGGIDHHGLRRLRVSAASYRPHFAQGVAFAAKARQRAKNPALHTDMACEIVCNLSADEAAAITDLALQDLALEGGEPEYQVWRSRIQDRFANLGS